MARSAAEYDTDDERPVDEDDGALYDPPPLYDGYDGYRGGGGE